MRQALEVSIAWYFFKRGRLSPIELGVYIPTRWIDRHLREKTLISESGTNQTNILASSRIVKHVDNCSPCVFKDELTARARELQITYPLAWDNGFEGNYWSDFDGVDSNHDGISDTGLAIGLDSINVDHFPLMGPFLSFNTSVGEFVSIISNSTVTSFHYEESKGWITIQVRNATPEQTFGFLRVSIPHDLIDPDVTWINVFINDGMVTPLYFNNTLYDNGTHRWIYVAYPHSLVEIVIVPEFPSLLILPLFMILTLMAAIVYKKKNTPENQHARASNLFDQRSV